MQVVIIIEWVIKRSIPQLVVLNVCRFAGPSFSLLCRSFHTHLMGYMTLYVASISRHQVQPKNIEASALLWKTKTGSEIQETTGTSKLQGKMMYKNRRPHPVRDGKLQKPGVVRSNKKQVYMRKQNFPNHFYPPIPFCVTQFDPKKYQ